MTRTTRTLVALLATFALVHPTIAPAQTAARALPGHTITRSAR